MSIRPVKRLSKSKPTLEGAGVHLRRAFGFGKTSDFDPFLLLDDFRNDVPEDYLAGFPWHQQLMNKTRMETFDERRSCCSKRHAVVYARRDEHRDLHLHAVLSVPEV